ncbi:MAG: ATP-dependent RNA helicase HrpA [Thermodesulfobacteriota bacterium]|nr:ATP-dependent RNA helicase HrpA [Thermodesulfobacteriota bacterium]
MKRIRRIEKKINQVMCQDRYRFIREITGLKKTAKALSGSKEAHTDKTKDLDRRITRLEQRLTLSLEKREKRVSALPELKYNPDLPITAKMDEIVDAVKQNRVVIISGETGSGKTTQIPRFCLKAGRGTAGKIGCTQPRRIAAINVAKRIAEELNDTTGCSVGYKIRFDDRSDPNAYIKLMTDGILLAEAQNDPFLNEYDTIIVDEAHERSLNIDFALGILRGLVKKRKDLKLIVTSATIDTEKFSKAFDNAPVIEVTGRTFPVDVRYADPPAQEDEKDAARENSPGDDQGYVEAASEALDEICRMSRRGDVLIFMPTEQDIRETMALIRGREYRGLSIMPLYARLPAKDQSAVFSQGPGRKVIVSTNVAETSLTIPGIRYVIDTGFARIPAYSPRTRTTALPVRPVSQSSADQRKGRCGRVENGICIRLYSEADYGARPCFTPPEILRSNLAEVILRMIALKLGDISAFPFIDAPSTKSIKDGFDTLVELNAITGKKRGRKKTFVLTETGRIMAGIPVDPKLSRILIEAGQRGCLNEALIIVSALSVGDPRQRPHEKSLQADQKHAQFVDNTSDFITLLNIWEVFKRSEKTLKTRAKIRKYCKDNFLSFKKMREWKDIHYQIASELKDHGIPPGRQSDSRRVNPGTAGLKSKEYALGGEFYIALHKSILSGYLANIAHKKEKNVFAAAKGRNAYIFPGSGLFKQPGNWIVAAEYVETSQLFARTAATIDPGWLEELGGNLCTYSWSDPHWEKKRGEVVASEQVSLFGLIIVGSRKVGYGRINPKEAGEIFIQSALVNNEVDRPFPFMEHNQALIDELTDIEDKTRKRDVLVNDADIFLFYQNRLEYEFSDIRTFARYLKDKQDDSFLRMTLDDLKNNMPDSDTLKYFPDYIETRGVRLELDYDFNPGDEKDGVRIKVPAKSAASVVNVPVDRLVPGLFREKVEALIKNLPKTHRKKLVPVSRTAGIIAEEMASRQGALFSELSCFVKKRFHVDIPASAWTDQGLEDYLKMGFSIRDRQDREIAFSRNPALLKDFSRTQVRDNALDAAKKQLEKENIRQWDFGDIEDPVPIKEKDTLVCTLFYGLQPEKETLALRVFRSADTALTVHKKGVMQLYEISFAQDVNVLKKDIQRAESLKRYAALFQPWPEFSSALYRCLLQDLFAHNIRTRQKFYDHAHRVIPGLHEKGADFIKKTTDICQTYETCLVTLKKLILKHQNRPRVLTLMESLKHHLVSLVPANFLDIYSPARIEPLSTCVRGICIRAERGAAEPVKDEKKQPLVEKYTRKLDHMLKELNETSSREKADAVEDFYWMIEEYKISLFAQELKTSIKISPQRLDKMYRRIMTMI